MEGALDWLGKFLGRIFGSRNERIVRQIRPTVDHIATLEPGIQALSDEQLRAKTAEFRTRLADGRTLDDILPEAFACAREAGRRFLKMRHFDVQLIGGYALHKGKITEMATGEGKTLVATGSAYLNALEGKGVHVITVNDYLARRDTQWMGPLYHGLGVSVACIGHESDVYLFDPTFNPDPEDKMHCLKPITRQEAYAADITYGTNHEYGFDFLRDNMKISLAEQVQQRGLHYAIVDEVDNILIDEARTPLIISGPAEDSTAKYFDAERLAAKLTKGPDYEVKEKEHLVVLTEEGIEKAQRLAGVTSFYEGENLDWPHLLENALKAKELYKRDKEYVVKEGEIIIVDEFTGRMMPGRRWSDGLHQAVEAKERVRIKEESQTYATITLQNFFKMYKKLAGMTGSAATEAMEFEKIYNLEVLVIPTNKAMRRSEMPDIVFRTSKEKYEAIVEEIHKIWEMGRPVLVGTTSIEKSELLSELLKRRGVKHEVLNAKHHEREAAIVAKAGQHGTVTIATNMAGRGTDILLGEGVATLGGLHVLGTERHEARRIDNQLRGRAGRQGDPGSSQFIVSLEDDLLRIFAPAWVSAMLKRLGMDEGVPIESRMVSRSIERAQKKMEAHNFDIRKNLLEYDGVMNEQRKIVYKQRQQILHGEGLREMVLEMIEKSVIGLIDRFLSKDVREDSWDWDGLSTAIERKFGRAIDLAPLKGRRVSEVEDSLIEKCQEAYKARVQDVGEEASRRAETVVLLTTMDEKWKDHLYGMDQLRSSVSLRGMGQLDPKVEYKREGFEIFQQMLESIQDQVSDLIMKVRIEADRKIEEKFRPTTFTKREVGQFEVANPDEPAEEKPKPIVSGEKIGRNDPCPCGSGKKYKKCCGRGRGGGPIGGEVADEDE